MSLSRVAISISDIEIICEIRDFESPFGTVGFDIPRGQVPAKVSKRVNVLTHALDINRRN
jgi:hypothetical protein